MIRKKILVTGGAGYIGSFIVRELAKNGFEPFIVDNFSAGHREAIEGFDFAKIDLTLEKKKLDSLFEKEKFAAAIHMAAFIQMGESFRSPLKYFDNNLKSALHLFEVMVRRRVLKIVFSSSAGVYGTPKSLPINEDDPKNPENPYGETKLQIEKILGWLDKAYGMKSVSIRYFNAAGAALDGSLGEDHPDESHLIPIAIKKAMKGETLTINGGDFETMDGTCIRDYVHVLDLAGAHILALKRLLAGGGSDVYNAGTGRGYSNKEVAEEIKRVVGDLEMEIGPRRSGDPAALYASIDKIKEELGWRPKYTLGEIIKSAYLWHKKHPK